MELCYHSYAILLGANQLFAAKQHHSDRSNGRQDHPQDAERLTGLRRGLAGIGLTFGFVLPFSGLVTLLAANAVADSANTSTSIRRMATKRFIV